LSSYIHSSPVVLSNVLVGNEEHVIGLARIDEEVVDFEWLDVPCIGHDHCHLVTLQVEIEG
jgi:hypothetical protein